MITQEKNINACDSRNSLSFLHSAINSNRTEIIFLLLEHKADPYIHDYGNRNTFFYAYDKEIIEALLFYSINNDKNENDYDHEIDTSELINSINFKNSKITELFLLYGADLLETDNINKHNVLHGAINVNHPDLCKTFLNWPYKLAESKGLFDQIKLLCGTSHYLNKVICYLLFLYKKIGHTLHLKIPKLIQITLIENCMSDHLSKLWQSPYAQKILESKDPQTEALSCVQQLISQKNILNKTPLEFVSDKLLIHSQDTKLIKAIHKIILEKNTSNN